MLPNPGKHLAVTGVTSVYENQNGTLVFSGDFRIDESTSIIGYFSLTTRDGALNERTIRNLMEVYGWDGVDPFWLADTDLSEIQVQINVEAQTRDDGSQFTTVRYLDKPGAGGGSVPECGNRNAILAKYGNRFRALLGGAQRPSPKPAAAAKPAPPAQAAPPAPPQAPLQPTLPTGPKCTAAEAWQTFCREAGDGWSEDGLTQAWYGAIEKLVGKPQANCTPEDWGRVAAGAKDYFADQIAV